MRYWIEYQTGNVKEHEADDLPDAWDHIVLLGESVKDWDLFSFRQPPIDPDPKEEYKYLPC